MNDTAQNHQNEKKSIVWPIILERYHNKIVDKKITHIINKITRKYSLDTLQHLIYQMLLHGFIWLRIDSTKLLYLGFIVLLQLFTRHSMRRNGKTGTHIWKLCKYWNYVLFILVED